MIWKKVLKLKVWFDDKLGENQFVLKLNKRILSYFKISPKNHRPKHISIQPSMSIQFM